MRALDSFPYSAYSCAICECDICCFLIYYSEVLSSALPLWEPEAPDNGSFLANAGYTKSYINSYGLNTEYRTFIQGKYNTVYVLRRLVI